MVDVLISVRPRFTERILAGRKTIELRRGSTRLRTGDRLYIYSSSPDRQVVGTCAVGTVSTDAPTRIYRSKARRAAVSRSEFWDYARGAEVMTALELVDVVQLKKPVSLKRIRDRASDFVVPQSYRYLSATETRMLRRTSRPAATA